MAHAPETCFPLSPAQQRQWLLWHLQPHSIAYHVGGMLTFTGVLDVPALHRAFNVLVRRHANLRTVFRVNDEGEPMQWVSAAAQDVPLPVTDLRGVPAAEREAEAWRVLRELDSTPFNLERGPLCRFALVRTADEEYRLLVVKHHIITDGVSIQVMLKELSAHYRAGGEDSTRPALATQYTDIAQQQRQWLQGSDAAHQLDWWRAQLGDTHPVLALPTDAARQPVASWPAAQQSVALDDTLHQRLRARAAASGVTLFTVMLAAFQLLLARYTGQQAIRVGVPVAGRQQRDTAPLMGFFVNTLVMPNRIRSDDTLADILVRARDAVQGGQQHQQLPFDHLVEALQPARSLSHTPLVQVLCNYQHERLPAWQSVRDEPLVLSHFSPLQQQTQFELTLDIHRRDGVLLVNLIYAESLFQANTMAQFGQHYVRVLSAFADDPAQTVRQVPWLDEAGQQHLHRLSEGPVTLVPGDCVHHLFEAQCARTPDADAVVMGEERLSYTALNRAANRLAHALMRDGIGPEQRVGIAMHRSLELVISLLAVMKTGAAYVPLDPDYPAQRLRYMMDDSGLSLLLTQAALRDTLPVPEGVRRMTLADYAPDDLPEDNPSVPLTGAHLIYLIYTSGSTGKPKGTANSHRALCNRLAWGQAHQPIGAGDTVMQKTPFSFDISFWEFFWPLTTGARLALAGPGEHRDPARLVALIRQHQVSTIHFVPSMLQMFLGEPGVRDCDSLKHVICSGEALSAELRGRTLRAMPQVSLLNLYGPTEAAIEVTWHDCVDDGSASVPIGRPLANVITRILDSDGAPVPVGVAGELCLGGVALARCYWRRAALTAERFIADPLATSGERLYRTGDLVRWRRDGEIDYLGRIDHQIKVRGFRIELGEIDAALLALPAVREAVVVARDTPAGTQLLGYVSLQPGSAGQASTLRSALADTLPDYMVPAQIVILDTLPLNSNGKIDRKALPAPVQTASEPSAQPRDATEQQIAAIWCEVLGVTAVGRHDSFFDVGGHSLLLMKVHRRLQATLTAPVTVTDLFRYPTIAALATFLARQQRAPSRSHDSTARAARQRDALRQRRKPPAERTPS
ncbi:amino acid adenylation domain-containing protein [Alcanivorax sp. S71-1-4]|uniref:non-ribosomal peptide synthetase n=1 Tax=Alcanivorax sp. S71-1-4 TaxID=1177159 RepID=UPI00135B0439|nr:non-ribosomal peptide synthetase [Alcanivorax sp. S71-1-4]KAF0809378.1 amino acid adenylation domain-containing protein [Alcanivorax sp. S71-1-4]